MSRMRRVVLHVANADAEQRRQRAGDRDELHRVDDRAGQVGRAHPEIVQDRAAQVSPLQVRPVH